MISLKRFLVASILIFLLVGCAKSTQTAHESVVNKLYDALSEGDRDKYLDQILPERRTNKVDLGGIFSALSLSIGSFGIDLGDLTQVTIRDLELTTIEHSDNYALVQAEGKMRSLMGEFEFCQQHDVVMSDDNWYIDPVLGQSRIEKILEQRMTELSVDENFDQELTGDLSDIGTLLNQTNTMTSSLMNLCD